MIVSRTVWKESLQGPKGATRSSALSIHEHNQTPPANFFEIKMMSKMVLALAVVAAAVLVVSAGEWAEPGGCGH
jgi:hypothetical protein